MARVGSGRLLASSVILALVMGLWQPMPAIVWSVDNAVGYWALWGLFGLGWLVLLLATFMVDHFDLFGLRQVWLHLRGKPYTPSEFRTPAFYRYVRHPIYVGFLLGFWAIPQMSVGHLVFAAA